MQSLCRRQFLATAAATAAGSLIRADEKADKPLRFKLGLVTYNVASQWDLPTTLKVCQEAGIAAVECRTTHKHGVEPTLNAAERREVKNALPIAASSSGAAAASVNSSRPILRWSTKMLKSANASSSS